MKWSDIEEFLRQHGFGWMTLPMFAMTVAWAVMFFLKYVMRMREETKKSFYEISAQMQHSFFLTEKLQDKLTQMKGDQDELLKKVCAMIDEAVKRAPPVEDPVTGVPFEEYRKDLLRMVDGEISIDEFVDHWRGRKVQKRPKRIEGQYKRGEWLRVIQPTSPAFRQLVAVEEAQDYALRGEWLTKIGHSTIINLSEGDFERALPEKGEWWWWTPAGTEDWKPFVWQEEPDEEKKTDLREKIKALQLQPHNFGLGTPGAKGEEDKENGVEELLGSEIFKVVLKEWALHIEANQGATIFANVYLGWMGDSGSPELKNLTAIFANFIKPRSWFQVLGAIYPHLDLEMARVFVRPAAEEFFNSFRAMIVEAIRDYWENWLEGRRDHWKKSLEEKKKEHVHSWVPTQEGMESCSCGALRYGPKKYLFGQWLRVTRPSSPAVGELVTIDKILPHEIRAEGRSVKGQKFFIGLGEGDFEPAYPKAGEWWTWTAVAKKEDLTSGREVRPFIWKEEPEDLREERRDQIKNMLLEPVNFGRGKME